jgi:hypothetical protein
MSVANCKMLMALTLIDGGASTTGASAGPLPHDCGGGRL